MKKMLAGVLVSALTAFSAPFAFADDFSDISEAEQDVKPISYLREQGVLKGYEDGTFRPRMTVNRAELVKILVVGQGIDPDSAEYHDCFLDVHDGWFEKYVCYAKDQGWVSGNPDGNFFPDKSVNRAEAAKMILKSLGVDETPELAGFDDVDSSDWFEKYARTVHARKLAVWEKFDADHGMTRAEVAVMLYRILVITQQDVEAYAENLDANFDVRMPVEIITLKDRRVDQTPERLNEAKALFDQGMAAGENEDWEGALNDFNSALLLAPRYANAWAGKAYAHYQLGQAYRGRFSINNALLISPRKPVYYAVKGALMYELDMPNRGDNHLLVAFHMREALEHTTAPLPSVSTWADLSDEAMQLNAEEAVETWAWDDELSADQWPTVYSDDSENEHQELEVEDITEDEAEDTYETQVEEEDEDSMSDESEVEVEDSSSDDEVESVDSGDDSSSDDVVEVEDSGSDDSL